jgi:predicted RNA binding protein YcfA (HicA-like mRNA interferase family)
MAHQVTRRAMEAWLLRHGFTRLKGKMSGHVQYEREGVKISLPGHGPADLTKKHVALIVRSLAGAGFDRARVLEELKGDG